MGLFDFLTSKKASDQTDAGATADATVSSGTQFTNQGAIPPVSTGVATSPAPSASDQAFADHAGLRRVQAACAAQNLPELINLEHELRKQMLTDPLHPPQDARDGLAVARQWTMDRVAEIVDKYQAQITTASTGSTGTPATDAVEQLENKLDDEASPFLAVLMEGDPQYRYLHFKQDVQDKVFTAVRIHSMRRGVNKIGHRAEAEDEARAHGNLPAGAWCGVFAYTQAEQAGGFDPHWKGYMQGESMIRSTLNYAGMEDVWIWAFDDWMKLHDYHAMRGSLRWYKTMNQNPQIQPGDLCLKDVDFGTDPDHITTVVAYDGRYVTTIGGNEGTDKRHDENGVKKSKPFDLAHNPAPNDVREVDDKGNRKMYTHQKDEHGNPIHKNERIHGIGRWSLVDYEQHLYKTSKSKPATPKPDDLKSLG